MSDHTSSQEQPQEIPYGFCHCGCGQRTPLIRKTLRAKGRIKGEPSQYVQGHNSHAFDGAPSGYKTCSRCNQTKLLSEFAIYKSGERKSRIKSHCRECDREICRLYHVNNRANRLAKIAEYRQKNKERLYDKERERRADPAYRAKASADLRDWRDKNKDYVAAYNQSLEVKARNYVNKLVGRGALPRPDMLVCNECQEAVASHYHHFNGYEQGYWADVVALCTVCHGKAHRKE